MADDVFRKGSASAPRGYFRWEAAGLAWLGDAPGGAAVAQVLEVGEDHLDLRRLTFANPDPLMAEAFGAALAGPMTPVRRRSGPRRPAGTAMASSGRSPSRSRWPCPRAGRGASSMPSRSWPPSRWRSIEVSTTDPIQR